MQSARVKINFIYALSECTEDVGNGAIVAGAALADDAAVRAAVAVGAIMLLHLRLRLNSYPIGVFRQHLFVCFLYFGYIGS